MPRLLINCPAGHGAVPTGFRTADINPDAESIVRAFRCVCGEVHRWSVDESWAEARAAPEALRAYGVEARPR